MRRLAAFKYINGTKIGLWFSLVVLLCGVFQTTTTYAISLNDLNSVYYNTPFYDPTDVGCDASSVPTTTAPTNIPTLVGKDNQEKAFNYFKSKGLTDTQAAAIFGNLMHESHMEPKAVQIGGGPGRGIAQWSVGERWASLQTWALQQRRDIYSLGTQLDYVWLELTTIKPWSTALTNLKKITGSTVADLDKATFDFNRDYERSADTPTSDNMKDRYSKASDALLQYGTRTNAVGSGGCSGSVNCNNGTADSDNNLSAVRRSVVCLAEKELDDWTPPPPKPRLGFTKYSDGVTGTATATEQWCSDFASWIYKQAGYSFTGGLSGGWRLPASDSVIDLAKQGGKFHWHPTSTGYIPKPGDLALHKHFRDGIQDLKHRDVSHINIVIAVKTDQNGIMHVTLIGGDQGSGPYGGPFSASVVSYAYSSVPPTKQDTPGDFYTVGYATPD